MEIKNTNKQPLRVPLPAGKRLFLKPGEKGQINHKAVEHPPLKKLIDEGSIEVLDLGRGNSKSSGGSGGISGSQDSGGSGAGIRKTGDR
ncbi:MAG: hypothetical protein QGI93_02970 [Planctomycetota bacterium]|jgi:hypothetical protein|nr:hypothetical protein [Candidatus Woesearchaeota archaeon]MDP6385136.1 hypothetical protein [Planctomycetota bacterium]MDP6738553.1 hypothetical protein [Planctomycetota bacterium]MDP6939623.1 hypothetical protein [Planctomycetota bacterium]